MEEREIEVNYTVGDTVHIVDGPLENFTGVVDEIDLEKNKVRVTISMFGRETPVELELDTGGTDGLRHPSVSRLPGRLFRRPDERPAVGGAALCRPPSTTILEVQ